MRKYYSKEIIKLKVLFPYDVIKIRIAFIKEYLGENPVRDVELILDIFSNAFAEKRTIE
jgi:hypothetical protein